MPVGLNVVVDLAKTFRRRGWGRGRRRFTRRDDCLNFIANPLQLPVIQFSPSLFRPPCHLCDLKIVIDRRIPMRQASGNPGGSVGLAQAVKREKRLRSKQEELVGKLRFEFQRTVDVFQRLFALAK